MVIFNSYVKLPEGKNETNISAVSVLVCQYPSHLDTHGGQVSECQNYTNPASQYGLFIRTTYTATGVGHLQQTPPRLPLGCYPANPSQPSKEPQRQDL
jgi:hypothetical protein